MHDVVYGQHDVLAQIRRARAIANGTSAESVANVMHDFANALERRWRRALTGSEEIERGARKLCSAPYTRCAVQGDEPKSMYLAAKRDVVREMMRARRLAAGLSDPATVRALEEYAVELETQWRKQHA